MTSPSDQSHQHEHFSLRAFLLTLAVTVSLFCGLVRVLVPDVWAMQRHAPGWSYLGVFAAITLVNCFIEFFFHRYVLHRPAIRGLGRLYRQHTLHHALTRIAKRPARDGRRLLFVENKFPIVEAEQGEGSFFPWYSLAVFTALLVPLFALLQWLVPAGPWFLGGMAAMASSLTLYELFHAVNHWPLERWLPLIEHPRTGRFWRAIYSFHLRHHAVIDCNESVSGFFGLPLADWLFGTCVIPPSMYADGVEWKAENCVAPRPCAFIRWLDRTADSAVTRRRQRASSSPEVATRERSYSRGEEIANWLTHGVGAALSLVGLTVLIVLASIRGDAWHVVSFTVFGLTLVALYLFSTLYHLTRSERHKWLFHRLDHAAIFLLIAGTYTPFLLTHVRGAWGWSVFGVTWGACGAGALFKFVAGPRSTTASVVTYLFASFLLLAAAEPMLGAVPTSALVLLIAGGVCYTAGLPFYLWRRLRYHHALWHSFVLCGSACHFLAVLFLLHPGHGH